MMNSIIKRLGALCLGLGVLLVPALAIGEVETLGSNRKEGIENKSPRKQHELVERYVDRYKGSKEDPIKVEEPHFNVGIKVIKVKQSTPTALDPSKYAHVLLHLIKIGIYVLGVEFLNHKLDSLHILSLLSINNKKTSSEPSRGRALYYTFSPAL